MAARGGAAGATLGAGEGVLAAVVWFNKSRAFFSDAGERVPGRLAGGAAVGVGLVVTGAVADAVVPGAAGTAAGAPGGVAGGVAGGVCAVSNGGEIIKGVVSGLTVGGNECNISRACFSNCGVRVGPLVAICRSARAFSCMRAESVAASGACS